MATRIDCEYAVLRQDVLTADTTREVIDLIDDVSSELSGETRLNWIYKHAIKLAKTSDDAMAAFLELDVGMESLQKIALDKALSLCKHSWEVVKIMEVVCKEYADPVYAKFFLKIFKRARQIELQATPRV